MKCPHQSAESTPTKQRHKVRFDLSICQQCPLKAKCRIFKSKGRYYFTHQDYLLSRRNGNIKEIPRERRKIRPNVEANMKEFKSRASAGKLKVRGHFKTSLFAFIGIAINFGRIYRYIADNELFEIIFSTINFFFNKMMTNLAGLFSSTPNLAFKRACPKILLNMQLSMRLNFGSY